MKLPKLPETVYGLTFYDEGGAHESLDDGFSEDAVKAYGLACARAALEEAAKVCEALPPGWAGGEMTCARAIRAIKIEGETP